MPCDCYLFCTAEILAIFIWFHVSYLKAGADLIETATYQASISGFVTHLGVTSDEALDLMRKAVNICKSAVDEFWQVVENRSGKEA